MDGAQLRAHGPADPHQRPGLGRDMGLHGHAFPNGRERVPLDRGGAGALLSAPLPCDRGGEVHLPRVRQAQPADRSRAQGTSPREPAPAAAGLPVERRARPPEHEPADQHVARQHVPAHSTHRGVGQPLGLVRCGRPRETARDPRQRGHGRALRAPHPARRARDRARSGAARYVPRRSGARLPLPHAGPHDHVLRLHVLLPEAAVPDRLCRARGRCARDVGSTARPPAWSRWRSRQALPCFWASSGGCSRARPGHAGPAWRR